MTNPAKRDVIVIGGSAGSVRVMKEVLLGLPPRLGASLLVTLHRHPHTPSELAHVLGRHCPLPVREPDHGEAVAHDVVYLAPPDRHMCVRGRHIEVLRGPKVHHTRPAIDPLFASAAAAYGRRTIGILLSGNLSDGVAGLIAIKSKGGLCLVQDPEEAEWPSMPRNALLYDHVDMTFLALHLPALLQRLIAGESVAEVAPLRKAEG